MWRALFDNVYVEKGILDDPETVRILRRIGCPEPEITEHYKDVFDKRAEKEDGGRNLILARNPGKHLYEGAPVCQSFGNEHFYYSPGVMNCVYDCEYCFLKGMYPGRDICIFTDMDETFSQIDELVKNHPVYVCASYNTDLTALEGITGYVGRWCEKAARTKGLSVEIRSKCGRTDIYGNLPVSDSAIFAFTLSPDEIITRFERKTPDLEARIGALNAAMKAGFPVRICFDPMIYVRNWRGIYSAMIDAVASAVDLKAVRDISIGTFRISDQYLKNMRKKYPDSAVTQYPYVNEDGYYQYPAEVRENMEGFMRDLLAEKCPDVQVFDWR